MAASFKTLLLSAALVLASPLEDRTSKSTVPIIDYDDILFVPPATYTDPRVLYARTAELTHSGNALLATWENYSDEPPAVYFPIFKSADHGKSWKHISNVTDQVNGWGLRYQPFLYELPVDYAGFKAGTVLLAGSSIPTDLSQTQIDLYASRDGGYNWEFVSHVAAGGEALPTNGLTPVWEPFIMMYDSQVIIYYSDQRMNATFGQYLVHQTSTDLRNWGPVVPDVEYPTYTDRPGMTTISKLPNGEYIMTYEYGHNDPVTGDYSFPVYYRINKNPLKFNESEGIALVPADSTQAIPYGSPYNVWSSVGGKNGTIIVSSGGSTSVWTNTALGDPNAWVERSTPAPTSYTRHLRVFAEDANRLLIMGGGVLPPSTTNNISYSIVSVDGLAEV